MDTHGILNRETDDSPMEYYGIDCVPLEIFRQNTTEVGMEWWHGFVSGRFPIPMAEMAPIMRY